jgi:TetR/AcrR family transcriptional repressor of nem operon
MRFEKGHKEETRKRIIKTAAARFRKDGVEAVGIAGLMAEAGLTHGGFYAHFESKEALLREAIVAAMDGTRERLTRSVDGPDGLEWLVRRYLRPSHRDTPEDGCAIASLVAEIARHEPATRKLFSGRVEAFLGRITAHLTALPEAERKPAAIGILGVMLGTLQLSRAVTDAAISDSVLESGIQAALRLAKPGP